MFGCMLVRGAIATQSNPTFLAGAQVHPGTVGFYTLLAYIVFGVLQFFYGLQVLAGLIFHRCYFDDKLQKTVILSIVKSLNAL